MALTKEDIFAIADKFKAEGINPTQNLVREELGGGSFATIGPALKKWKDMQHKEHALLEIQIPKAVKDKFEQLQAEVWQTAAEEADQRLAIEKQALQEAKVAADAAVSEADEAVKILEKEAEERDSKLEKLGAELTDAETRAENAENEKTRAEHEVARLSEKIKGLDARLADAQTARAEARADADLVIKMADATAERLKKYEAYFEKKA